MYINVLGSLMALLSMQLCRPFWLLNQYMSFILYAILHAVDHFFPSALRSTLMVATHTDKIHNDKEVKKRMQCVNRSIRRRAEELGLSEVLCEDFIDVNATDEDDCNKVKCMFVITFYNLSAGLAIRCTKNVHLLTDNNNISNLTPLK